VFDRIAGLPAHPLLVHAPVVLIPVTALLAVAYALLPMLRPRIGWVLVLSSLAAAGSAWGAAQAGKQFAKKLPNTTALNNHGRLGDLLWQYAILLAVVAVVLVAVDTSRRNRPAYRRGEDEYGYSHRAARTSGGMMLTVVSVVLTLGLLGAAGVAGYYVVRTGDSGARMVWSNR
jgi:uncharacterized membrane protein